MNKSLSLISGKGADVHLQEILTQTNPWAVAGKTAGYDKPTARVTAKGIHDPLLYLFTLGKIGYFVQAIQQEKEIASFKKTITKALRGFQMRVSQLLLNKGIQTLIKLVQLSEW